MYLHAFSKRNILELDESELEITKDTILVNSVACFIMFCSIMLAINEASYWPGMIYLFITPLIFFVFFIRSIILKKKT